MMTQMNNKRAQTFIEYATLLMIIMAGVIIMGPYVMRSWNAHVKGWEDSVKDSVEDPLEQTNDKPDYLPACVCEWKVPDICTDPTKPCCGKYGCGVFEETLRAEICTPLGCKQDAGKECRANSACCSQVWEDFGCQAGNDGQCNCQQYELCQRQACGGGSYNRRCVQNNPTCAKTCQGSPPPAGSLEATKIASLCSGDDMNLTENIDISYIEEARCNEPENVDPVPIGQKPNKCQYQCREPFIPNSFADGCICPPGSEEFPPGVGSDPNITVSKKYCRCKKLADKGTCTGITMDTTGCPAHYVKICQDSWSCCPKFATEDKIQSTNFSDSVQSGNGAGASCPNNYVMTGIWAVGISGGQSSWFIKCHKLPTKCFGTAPIQNITSLANPPSGTQFSQNSTNFSGKDCPSGYVAVGIQTKNFGSAGLNTWDISCRQVVVDPSPSVGCFEGKSWTLPLGRYFTTGSTGTAGTDSATCTPITGIHTQKTGSKSTWYINGMK
jgi:hypothetical protein